MEQFLEQSESWDKIEEFRKKWPDTKIKYSFPYANWPPNYQGREYHIILYNSVLCCAYVDDSEAHRADGILWRSIGGIASWPKDSVVAWKLHK